MLATLDNFDSIISGRLQKLERARTRFEFLQAQRELTRAVAQGARRGIVLGLGDPGGNPRGTRMAQINAAAKRRGWL